MTGRVPPLEQRVSLGMIIDSSRCIDCKACLVSCKVANNVPEGQWRNWIKSDSSARDARWTNDFDVSVHYQPGGCMHCADAPCLDACPTGATYRNPVDGVILVDKALCIGCGSCIPACPYQARFRHAVENVVDKCDFCAERRAKGLQPACVDTCPTKARIFGPLGWAEEQAESRFSAEGAALVETLVAIEPKEAPTGPRLLYVNATKPQEWPVQAQSPLPMRLMTGLPGKALFAAVGASFLGVLVMCLTQFREQRMARKQHDAIKHSGGAQHDQQDQGEEKP